MRKSLASLFLVVACWAALTCSPAFAAPTTTAAATFNNGFILTPNTGKWTTILTTTIKNPTADDDLFIDVSQVDALVTANLNTSTAGFSAGVVVLLLRVLVDGLPATPGAIDFDNQVTELNTNLQKFITLSCTTAPAPQTIVTTSCVCTALGFAAISCAPPPAALPQFYTTRTCTSQTTIDHDVVTTCNLLTDGNQVVETVLESSIGHSYDFFAAGVNGIGDTHIVQVQEQLLELTAGIAGVEAFIGPSTLKIMAVNLK